MCEEISDGLGRIIAAVRASLKRIEVGQEEIINILKARPSQFATVKEIYSPTEVAQLLGKQSFTVREWCRLGRIKAKKRACGSGASFAWGISHDELDRISNHGLLPIPKRH